MSAANLLGMGFPNMFGCSSNSLTIGTFQVDASTKGIAWLIQAPVADTITHVGFRYGARTGTPPTYRISLQSATVAGGVPDAAVLGGGTPASATFTPPADATWDGTWQWVALDNSLVVTRGQELFAVVEYSSGTIDASNRSSFCNSLQDWGTSVAIYPYTADMTASTWTKRTNSAVPLVGLRSASARYGAPVQSQYTTVTAATNGHRSAMTFTLPAGHGDTFQVAGVRFLGRMSSGTGQTYKIGLWDATTELQADTRDSDILATTPTQVRACSMLFTKSTLDTLSFGTKYYVGLEVTSSSAVSMQGWTFASADDAAAMSGGSSYCLATYNGSAWSDTTTTRPVAELILADITEPTAGGGAGESAALVGGIHQ